MGRLLVGIPLATFAQVVSAQAAYPSRPITMVVGFAPGGGTDVAARILAQRLADTQKQSFVVENDPFIKYKN